MAETLRLELAPFGVGVLSVVTGAVKSQGQTYFGDLELPPHSLYKSIQGTVVSRAQGNDGVPRMDTSEYASAVVDDIVNRKTGRVWYGTFSERVKMSTTSTVPQDVMDAGAVAGTGLDELPKQQ